MKNQKKIIKHLMYVPFTGLGLYGGFRGMRWFRNRIKVFKRFVIPSLLAQTSQNYILWISFTEAQRGLKEVVKLKELLKNKGIKYVFTYSGCCFWDDKHPDEVARIRLIEAIHGSMGSLINALGECDEVLMTIQPSDDCYHKHFVEEVQERGFNNGNGAVGFKSGYIINYKTMEVKEYNPKTNPPFFTIKFDRETFIDPLKHLNYIGPYKSHEYIGDHIKYATFDSRGFLVGIHGFNISTVFDHPYAGITVKDEILKNFGLENVGRLEIKFSLRSWVFSKFPYRVKRKLRFWAGEKKWILRPIFSLIYNFLRD